MMEDRIKPYAMEDRVKKYARFVEDDPGGLWKAGEIVEDLGPESPGLSMILLRKFESATEEYIALSQPYERGLIEALRI